MTNHYEAKPKDDVLYFFLIAPKKWREDYRCGKGHPAEDGNPAECDPAGDYPCCSPANWCGNTADHCDCPDCVDYRNTGCEISGYASFKGVCYKDFPERMTYAQARQRCAADGAMLAMPKNREINAFIDGVSREMWSTRWIGLTDTDREGRWVFEDGISLMSTGYSNWFYGEPDNFGNREEDCAQKQRSWFWAVVAWADVACGETSGFVCQIADTTVPPTTIMQPPATNAPTSETSTAQVSGNQGGTQGISCGQTTLLAGSGYVTSPNYPDLYPDNLVCNYHIAATPGKIVLIRFIGEFELESARNGGCEYDYITVVLDGSETLGTYCSSREPPSAITGTTVDVRLSTDYSNRRKGFRLRYEAVDPDSALDLPEMLSTCEAMSTITVSGVKGTLTSPMFPDIYLGDLSCSWTFLAPQDKFVEVRFLTMYMEASRNCRYDRVVLLIDGVESSDGPYCYNAPSEAFYGKSVTVKFITDSSVADQGFEMTYQSVEGVASGTCTNKDLVPCGDKRCIPSLWRCDDVWDCDDGADERDCPFQRQQTTATSATNTTVRSQTTATQMSSSTQPTQRSTDPGLTASHTTNQSTSLEEGKTTQSPGMWYSKLFSLARVHLCCAAGIIGMGSMWLCYYGYRRKYQHGRKVTPLE
ncbi:uncharacterized protein LOC144862917 [Branchiostoma floridae x Branchiostoma japonicum]